MDFKVVEDYIAGNKPCSDGEARIFFSDKRYDALDLTKDNFHEIKDMYTEKAIGFVDGGNAEIFRNGGLSISVVRVYCCVYRQNKRTEALKKEFFVAVRAINRDGRLLYEADVIGNEKIEFDAFDETLKDGINKADMSKIANIIRRFEEIRLCSEMIGKADIIVMDGSLQSSVVNEADKLGKLFEKAKENNCVVTGLSKSTSLITTNSVPVTSFLDSIAPLKEWYYWPSVNISHSDHMADLYFVKLHKSSGFVFRFEVFSGVDYNIDEVLSLLKLNSRDAAFPGYPYGLVEADRFARVSNREAEYFKTKLSVLSKSVPEKTAHNILDSIG